YVYNLEHGIETRLTTDGSETILNGTLSWVYWEEVFGRQDIAYWWSDDSKAIAFLQTDESPVSEMSYVDFKPQVPMVHTQRYPKAGDKNPIVRAGVVEISNPKPTWADISDSTYEYIARVKWLPDNKRFSVQTMNRAQAEIDLHFVDRYSGKSTFILKETDPAWVNIHDDLYFLKNSKEFIWASERSGYAHLYRYAMDGNLINPITQGDWAIHASSGIYWLRQAVIATDEKSQWIYFTALEKSSIERQLYRIKFDGTKMEQLSQEDGVHIITFSPDAKYYVDRFSSMTKLPGLFLHRNDGKLVQNLGTSKPELIAKFEIQIPELFTIATRDSFSMPASIVKPKNFDPTKKYPIILSVYGGPSAPTVINSWNGSIYFDQLLVNNGFLVASVDNRSATAISKLLENTTLLKAGGEGELNDLLDAVNWFKSQSWIDPDRIGVWGWSGGGTFTLNAMTHSAEFKAGIAVAAVTDWHYYDSKWAEAAMKRPEDNPEGYEKTSLVKSAKNLSGRLLLVHGTYDDNVHIQNAWAFTDELIKAGKTFDMMIYPMRQHGISDRPARIHLYKTMLEFWKENL
ncbi:MAG TPA: S9 family peptidase, partial [bacterium]